jgi:hypothetical protein
MIRFDMVISVLVCCFCSFGSPIFLIQIRSRIHILVSFTHTGFTRYPCEHPIRIDQPDGIVHYIVVITPSSAFLGQRVYAGPPCNHRIIKTCAEIVFIELGLLFFFIVKILILCAVYIAIGFHPKRIVIVPLVLVGDTILGSKRFTGITQIFTQGNVVCRPLYHI